VAAKFDTETAEQATERVKEILEESISSRKELISIILDEKFPTGAEKNNQALAEKIYTLVVETTSDGTCTPSHLFEVVWFEIRFSYREDLRYSPNKTRDTLQEIIAALYYL
jgi:hypothetical protein